MHTHSKILEVRSSACGFGRDTIQSITDPKKESKPLGSVLRPERQKLYLKAHHGGVTLVNMPGI